MSLEQTLSLLEAITDLQDLCLMHVESLADLARGDGVPVEILDGSLPAAWYMPTRGQFYKGAVQVEGEQSTYISFCGCDSSVRGCAH